MAIQLTCQIAVSCTPTGASKNGLVPAQQPIPIHTYYEVHTPEPFRRRLLVEQANTYSMSNMPGGMHAAIDIVSDQCMI